MTSKRHIARILAEIAFYLRLKGDNPYKSAAYERAGSALLLSPDEAEELLQGDLLTDISGIGQGTAAVTAAAIGWTSTGGLCDRRRHKGSHSASIQMRTPWTSWITWRSP